MDRGINLMLKMLRGCDVAVTSLAVCRLSVLSPMVSPALLDWMNRVISEGCEAKGNVKQL